MRIAVMGTGGVGGTFGLRLALTGHDVHFIARGAHLDAIRKNGLRVEGVRGEATLTPTQATDDPRTIGPVDLVLFCVKLWDTETAGQACKPLIGSDTAVLTLQNGVDGVPILSRILGAKHVMGGAAGIFATIARPGVITQPGPVQAIAFGEQDGRLSPRAIAFRDAFTAAGIDCNLSAQADVELWKKFVYLTALSGMTCYARKSIGPVRDDPRLWAMFHAAVQEAVAVGKAKGVAFAPGVVEERVGVAQRLAPEMRSSMLHDLDRGSRLELPWLSGAVQRMGRETGVPTPTHDAIVAALTPFAEGNKA